jgi:hypothetical protein
MMGAFYHIKIKFDIAYGVWSHHNRC